MVIEALVADSGRDDAGIDAVHRRANGRGGRDIVFSPITHCVFQVTSSYGRRVRQSDRICVEAVQTSQNRSTKSSLQQQESRRKWSDLIWRIRLHLCYTTCSNEIDSPQGGSPIPFARHVG